MTFILFLILFFLTSPLCAQECHRVMFYNVENFFDCEDDPCTNDNEFLPTQGKYWTPARFQIKRDHIASVIAAVGKGHPPMLVGLAEIENDAVLKQLVLYSPLRKWNYQYAHFESPDARGIDVALLYDPTQFQVLDQQRRPVCFANGSCSRDILCVQGQILPSQEVLYVLVCHSPSRRGGASSSAYKRCMATSQVRAWADQIVQQDARAKVLIMGDFNDGSLDASITECLGAKRLKGSVEMDQIYQMMPEQEGTYKYKGEWSTLDQMFVSSSLLQPRGYHVKFNQAFIFRASFLLQDDKRNLGVKPYRTYQGPRYLGGFSDHLPVYLDLLKE